MKTHPTRLFAVLALIFGVAPASNAQTVPPMINYQGRLVNSNAVPLATGDYELTFNIYAAATGGSNVWGPQVFDGQAGVGHGAKISVVQGYFNSILGPADTAGRPISSAFNGTNRFLEIAVGTNPPILPRQQVLTAPYAFRAETATLAERAQSLIGAVTTQPFTLYVRTNGLDSNDGLDASHPKKTIQAAVDAVPTLIRHVVTIDIGPGRYHEAIRIFNKRAENGVAFLRIENPSLNAADVVIDGLRPDSSRIPQGILINQSTVYIRSLTLSNNNTCVVAYDRSTVVLENCKFPNSPQTINAEFYCYVQLEDCLLQSSTPGSGIGVGLFQFSCGNFVNRPTNEWDPGNSIDNTIKDMLKGIVIQQNSLVLKSPVFMNVGTSVEKSTGGEHYP